MKSTVLVWHKIDNHNEWWSHLFLYGIRLITDEVKCLMFFLLFCCSKTWIFSALNKFLGKVKSVCMIFVCASLHVWIFVCACVNERWDRHTSVCSLFIAIIIKFITMLWWSHNCYIFVTVTVVKSKTLLLVVVCLLYCSLNFMYYYFMSLPWPQQNCPLWDD